MPKRARDPSSSSTGLTAPGGHRQKQVWANENLPQLGQSKLARLLIDRWSLGQFSAPLIQQVAAAAQQDGLDHADIDKLAALGTRGQYAYNCHRDLVSKLRPSPFAGCLSDISVYIKNPPMGMTRALQQVLLPHQMFAALYDNGWFDSRMCGGSPDRITEFWDCMVDHPAYAVHPLKRRADHKQKCVPITLHGDGVPVAGVSRTWSKSVDVYSWSSILAKGSTIDTHHLIYLIYGSLIVQHDDFNVFKQFSKLLCWSLYWLFLGVWPRRDEHDRPYPPGSPAADRAGKQLAGGYYATLWVLRGDLDHVNKAWGFPMHSEFAPCALCKANKGDLPWTDARHNEALWIDTTWTNDTWSESHPDRHQLFRLPGVGLLTFIPDIMHCMHLGSYQYFFGSVLHLLTAHHMAGTVEENLEQIWRIIKRYYQARVSHSCREPSPWRWGVIL